MRIVFACPACHRQNLAEVSSDTAAVRCDSCSWQRPVSAENRSNQEPTTCVVCGCGDIWRQKGFPPRVGVLCVVIGALISTFFWNRMEPVWSFGVLLAVALLDGVLYFLLRDVLVCYRCRTQHRRAVLDGRHEQFDLETHERYRQEAIRLEEAQRGAK